MHLLLFIQPRKRPSTCPKHTSAPSKWRYTFSSRDIQPILILTNRPRMYFISLSHPPLQHHLPSYSDITYIQLFHLHTSFKLTENHKLIPAQTPHEQQRPIHRLSSATFHDMQLPAISYLHFPHSPLGACDGAPFHAGFSSRRLKRVLLCRLLGKSNVFFVDSGFCDIC